MATTTSASSLSDPVRSAPEGSGGRLSETLRRIREGDLGSLPVAIGLVLVVLFFASRTDAFLTPRNASNLILQVAAIAIIASGSALVLLVGQVDLSAGPLSAVAACATALVSVNQGWPAIPAIMLGLITGAGCGALMGLLVTHVGVPAFVVTLGGWLTFTGLVLILLGDGGSVLVRDKLIVGLAANAVPAGWGWALVALITSGYGAAQAARRRRRAHYQLSLEPWWYPVVRTTLLGASAIGLVTVLNQINGIPVAGVILLAIVSALHWATTRTGWGRYVYAVGGNSEAARRAGVNVVSIQLTVFTIAGTLSSAGGILLLSRSSSVTTASGGGSLTLNVIAAAVIGGVSLFGGRGRVWSALLGAFVLGSALNGMDLLSVSAGVRNVVIGLILVAAVTVDALARKSRRATGRA